MVREEVSQTWSIFEQFFYPFHQECIGTLHFLSAPPILTLQVFVVGTFEDCIEGCKILLASLIKANILIPPEIETAFHRWMSRCLIHNQKTFETHDSKMLIGTLA